MTWARLDDGFYDHPKIEATSVAAVGLWVKLLTYCCKHLTDGFFSPQVAARMADSPSALIDELVKNGLIDVTENGYEIHDFLDYNFDKETTNKRRRNEQKNKSNAGKRSGEARRNRSTNTAIPVRTDCSTEAAVSVQTESEQPVEPIPYHTHPIHTVPHPSIPKLESKAIVAQKSDESLASQVRQVLEHYRKAHPKNRATPESSEGRMIACRLKEGSSVEDLCQASDGYHSSPFHCGDNEHKRVYLGLDLIYRNQSKVQQGMELWQRRGEAGGSTKQLRDQLVMQRVLDRLDQGEENVF